jgi:hypothetical protein
MQVEGSEMPGFGTDTMVKAVRTQRVYDSKGVQIKIKADSVGIPDSSAVTDGHQFVHFEVGGNTPCVRFPVGDLASL